MKPSSVVKRGPWLERGNYCWAPASITDSHPPGWSCSSGIDKYWDVRGAYRIRIWGSTKKIAGTVAARPAMGRWTLIPDKTGFLMRAVAYAHWLESFNAPVVYVWVEGWWWV